MVSAKPKYNLSLSVKNNTAAVTFRTVQFTIHLQKNGWLLEPLDAGFRERTSGGPPNGIKNILNPDDNELPAAPVPLNGSGVALADPSPANSVFLSFAVYETLAFSVLPLT